VRILTLGYLPLFADACSPLEDAQFVLIGVPFDVTSSYRSGSKLAPNKIRDASYNLETYIHEYDIDLKNLKIHDIGNVEECAVVEEMWKSVGHTVQEILNKKSFPILIGGEHSITVPAVKTIKPNAVIVMDAHLDFRDEYLGIRGSHACTTRRICELVDPERVVVVGVRSFTKEEKIVAMDKGLKYITADEIRKEGIENTIKTIHKHLYEKGGARETYITLDIDAIDPAYAPGTGTPEPYGLTHLEIRELLNDFAKLSVGFDVVEVCPPYDDGSTSVLAAKIIRDFIALVWKNNLFKRYH
jgi:agmatinase